VTVQAFIGMGSNVGDRRAHCGEAQARLGRLPETEVLGVSPLVETQPAEGVAGGAFLNGVAKLATALPPRHLLRELQAIEKALGRPPDHGRGTARTIDLDILLYGDRVVRGVGLEIPHPRLSQRRFVLEPLVALAPNVRHPILNLSALEMLQRLEPAGAPQPASDTP